MPPRAGADPGGGAAALAAPAPSRLLLPLLLVTLITAALMPGAAGYADTPQVRCQGQSSKPVHSHVNRSMQRRSATNSPTFLCYTAEFF